MAAVLLLSLLLVGFPGSIQGSDEPTILPIVLMHGVLSGDVFYNGMQQTIRHFFPTAEIHPMEFCLTITSFTPIMKQVEMFEKEIKLLNLTNRPYNLITHSQGSMIARAMLESCPTHTVHNWISLAGPLMGQFGTTMFLDWLFPDEVDTVISRILYLDSWQKAFSVAQYWNDPFKRSTYLKHCALLPILNNEIPHANSDQYKQNFLRVNRILCMGGPDDGYIDPWQSSLWGFFKEGSHTEVQAMEQTEIYQKDLFGLKTLKESGRLTVFELAGITHKEWYTHDELFHDYFMPYLL